MTEKEMHLKEMKKCPADTAEIAIIDEARTLLEEEYGNDYRKFDIRYHMIRYHMKGLLAYFCFNAEKFLEGNDLSSVRRMTRLVLKTQAQGQSRKYTAKMYEFKFGDIVRNAERPDVDAIVIFVGEGRTGQVVDVIYEDGMYGRFHGKTLKNLELIPHPDAERIDWLADTENEIGAVMLPTECVEMHPDSLRAAIDAARERETLSGNDTDVAPTDQTE